MDGDLKRKLAEAKEYGFRGEEKIKNLAKKNKPEAMKVLEDFIKQKKEEDEGLRSEGYRIINAIEKAGKVNYRELGEVKSTVMNNKSVMSNELKNKCKNLIDKQKNLANLAGEMKNVFKREKTFIQALRYFRSQYYFPQIRTALTDVLSASKDLRDTYPKQAKKKIKIKRKGKETKKTYAEVFPAVYKKTLPTIIGNVVDNANALSAQYNKLRNLIQQTVKKQEEVKKRI